MIFSQGVLPSLPWWGYVATALVLTHVTIAGVTIFLHRHQAHRALELHPGVSHFFRFWLWLTTGMVTREWAAVHRKHHAKCETPEDPHSPQVHGLVRVLFGGVLFYANEAKRADTLERYGHGTPDDWIEHNLYGRYSLYGVFLLLAADLFLFGALPGGLIWLTQILWIPFWAAGVVNGVGHYWGYRNWITGDASTNILPVGIVIGGEELHNNHHAYPTSAKLSYKWYEFDIAWLYIRVLETFGLATVKHVAPVARLAPVARAVDVRTVQQVIRHRYDVLANYAKSIRRAYKEELRKLRQVAPQDARALKAMKSALNRDGRALRDAERVALTKALPLSRSLQTMYSMREELSALWSRSMATHEQLRGQLQDWCRRAEASGIEPLIEISTRLRSYA